MTLKMVMAVSKEGYVARGPRDNMAWTGSLDKALFRLLTLSDPVVGMSKRTLDLLPGKQWEKGLPGREVVELSRFGTTVEKFALDHPGAWLAAGPSLGIAAIEAGVVKRVFMCHLRHMSIGVLDAKAIRDPITPHITGAYGHNKGWYMKASIPIQDAIDVKLYERRG